MEFYLEDKIIKTIETLQAEQIQTFWTATDVLITDAESGHRTRMTSQQVVYNRGLPEGFFSQKTLEDPERERAYRLE